MIRGDPARADHVDQLARLGQRRGAKIHPDRRASNKRVIHFALRGDRGADDVHMHPIQQPCPVQHGLRGTGQRAQDIGARHGVAHALAMGDGHTGMGGARGLGKGGGFWQGAPHHMDRCKGANRADRRQVMHRLFAGADQHQVPRIRPGQRACGDGAGGGGADRGQQPGIHHRHRAAGLGLEQHHRPAMTRQPARRIGGEQADQLDTVTIGRADGAGHDPHPVRLAHRHDMAQRHLRATVGDMAHHAVDDLDRLLHRQQRGHVGIRQNPHATPSFQSLGSGPRPSRARNNPEYSAGRRM